MSRVNCLIELRDAARTIATLVATVRTNPPGPPSVVNASFFSAFEAHGVDGELAAMCLAGIRPCD